MRDYGRTALAVLAATALASSAQASLVQVRDAVGGEDADGVSDGYFLSGTGNFVRGTMYAGPYTFIGMGTFALEEDTGQGFQSLLTYCIEPHSQISFGLNPPDNVGATYNEELLTNVGFSAFEELVMEKLWANAFAISTTGRQEAAAFQSIIWELRSDDGFDLSSGDFSLDSTHAWTAGVKAIAQGWINNIANGTWTNSIDLIALASPDSQDYIRPALIPAPGAAVLLLLAGIVGFTGRRRTAAA